jgi:ribosome-binding factor A
MASGQRLRRINEAIRHALAEAVARDLNDPRLQLVTITEVRATPDVGEATVFFTTFDAKRREGAGLALESARGLLQSRVASALGTRQTPQLRFVYDNLQEEAVRLTALIDRVAPTGPPLEEPGE